MLREIYQFTQYCFCPRIGVSLNEILMLNYNLFSEGEVITPRTPVTVQPIKKYPTDLTDDEWSSLQDLVPILCNRGRPRKVNMHNVFDGIFYILKTCSQLTYIPNDFHPHVTVKHYYDTIRDSLDVVCREVVI